MRATAEQLELPTVITVHCCFCKHTEVTAEPRSDAMEDHYFERHRELIEHATGSPWERPNPIGGAA